MKRCHHPARSLHWNPGDGVFVCLRCGQIIFPAPTVTPDDEFADLDEALCWSCGGTGRIDGIPCEDCAGDGFILNDE